MERTHVSSSNILSIGYDPDSSTLEIEFKGGSVYQYAGVPQAEFDGLMGAGSHGVYFNGNIKHCYPCVKL
jgi:hypothetical protein